jgi:hypothetical protein
MTVQQWIESTHRDGDQSLICVSPDTLAGLLAERDRLRRAIEMKDAVINELEGELAAALRGEGEP